MALEWCRRMTWWYKLYLEAADETFCFSDVDLASYTADPYWLRRCQDLLPGPAHHQRAEALDKLTPTNPDVAA